MTFLWGLRMEFNPPGVKRGRWIMSGPVACGRDPGKGVIHLQCPRAKYQLEIISKQTKLY